MNHSRSACRNCSTTLALIPSSGARIPLDVQLRDETGRDVQVSELMTDKPVILVFVYYRCPMLCNLTMEGLVRGLSRVPLTAGQDFSVVMVSIDPRETQSLAAAARQKAIDRYARTGDGRRLALLYGRRTAGPTPGRRCRLSISV